MEEHHRDHEDVINIDDLGFLRGGGIDDGYAIHFLGSDRRQRLWPGESHVLGIVWHGTDTRSVGAAKLAARIASLPRPGQRSASWHMCIDRSGAAVQSVSALSGSWHAGGPTAARFAVAGMENGHRLWGLSSPANRGQPGANDLFFGIELENVGELRLVDKEWLGWPFKRGLPVGAPIVVPEDEVHIESNGKAWHTFTDAQVLTASSVTSALVHKYNLLEHNCRWSHQQIDPQNRTDPGPAWMGIHLPQICTSVFGSK